MAKVDHLACGECGGMTFSVHHVTNKRDCRVGSGPFSGGLRFVCLKCGKKTTLKVSPPTLTVDGTLCGGWSNLPGPVPRPGAKEPSRRAGKKRATPSRSTSGS